jgi:hypothetical protein
MSTSNANVFVSDVFSQQPRVNEQTSMAEKKDESFVFAEIHNSLLHNLLYKLNNALKKQKSNSFSTSIDTFQTNILAKLDNILQYVSSKSSQETINILNSDATVDILSRLSNISLENIKMMHMKQPLLGQTLQRLGALDRILQCPLSALK